MTAGQYIVVAVYDENSCSAEGTCNLTILKQFHYDMYGAFCNEKAPYS